MERSLPKGFFIVFLSLYLSFFKPLYSGSDSDFSVDITDQGNDGGDIGFDIFGIPILLPYADYHKQRLNIKLRPPAPAFSNPAVAPLGLQKPGQGQNDFMLPLEEDLNLQDKSSISERHDKYGREIFTLDHGSEDDPYLTRDFGILNLGLLAGVSFTDPDSYVVQYNALMKLFYTSGTWSDRIVDNYDESKNIKKLKFPKKPKHFDDWKNGDKIEVSGNMAVALYAGVSVILADARAGSILIGKWHKKIEKLDENTVRISYTRNGGGGLTMRIQPLPLAKIEGTALKEWEGTLVYNFDRSTEEGRKALKDALHDKIFIKQDTDEDNVTLLTERHTSGKKIRKNLQIGFPFIARARTSWHKVKLSQDTLKNRNNTKVKLASKGYLKQKAYRHINLPKTNKHKKWKHYAYTNFHYNRAAEGSAVIVKNNDNKEVKRSEMKLVMEISFSHDKVKVKKVNEYNKKISRKVGLNDYVIDTGYKKKKQIGYVGISYRLNVGTEALNSIINKAHENKHLFDDVSHNLLTQYFREKNDPHSICRGKLTNKNLCINYVSWKTKRGLDKVSHYLRKLHKSKVAKSKSSSSTYLAKIARKLRANQFVLQSFVASLPENPRGYGIYSLEGAEFYGEKFIIDPNNQRPIIGDYDPEDDLLLDRNDALLNDEDYDMF